MASIFNWFKAKYYFNFPIHSQRLIKSALSFFATFNIAFLCPVYNTLVYYPVFKLCNDLIFFQRLQAKILVATTSADLGSNRKNTLLLISGLLQS
jgi:hypothetical protein